MIGVEQAIQRSPPSAPSKEERYVLAIEALEREVNNGGYGQFFINSRTTSSTSSSKRSRPFGAPRSRR